MSPSNTHLLILTFESCGILVNVLKTDRVIISNFGLYVISHKLSFVPDWYTLIFIEIAKLSQKV